MEKVIKKGVVQERFEGEFAVTGSPRVTLSRAATGSGRYARRGVYWSAGDLLDDEGFLARLEAQCFQGDIEAVFAKLATTLPRGGSSEMLSGLSAGFLVHAPEQLREAIYAVVTAHYRLALAYMSAHGEETLMERADRVSNNQPHKFAGGFRQQPTAATRQEN